MTGLIRALVLGHAALQAGSASLFASPKLRFLGRFRALAALLSGLCRRFITAAVLGLALIGPAQAAIDTYVFANEGERERYRTLVEELRCPKCQNQNIADSDAPIAMDLRAQIFRMLDEGQTDPQIIDFLVSRYGDFVLYKPPVTARTLLLWYGPGGLLAGGFVLVAVILIRRRRKPGATASGLSADEQQRLAALLSPPSTPQPPVDKRD